jgi:hypothetical protein
VGQKYYSKYTIVLVFLSIVYISTLFFLAGKDYFNGYAIQKISFILRWSLVFGMLVVPVLTWVLVRCFPVYVKKEGLRSYNIYCFYKDIFWDDIETINPINILGLKYIRVKSKLGGTPIWIPIWIDNIDSFLDTIDFYGGDKSLFQKYFEKPS